MEDSPVLDAQMQANLFKMVIQIPIANDVAMAFIMFFLSLEENEG
jgi:hypothetical protein